MQPTDLIRTHCLLAAGLNMHELEDGLRRIQQMGLTLCPACALMMKPLPADGPDDQGYLLATTPGQSTRPSAGRLGSCPPGPPSLGLARRGRDSLSTEEARRKRGGRVRLTARAPTAWSAGAVYTLIVNMAGYLWCTLVTGVPFIAYFHLGLILLTLAHLRREHARAMGRAPARALIQDDTDAESRPIQISVSISTRTVQDRHPGPHP